MPAKTNLARSLADQGLIDPQIVAEVERLEAMLAGGGKVDLGPALELVELQALADVTPEDVARAAADFRQSAPDWARTLLDAEAKDGIP